MSEEKLYCRAWVGLGQVCGGEFCKPSYKGHKILLLWVAGKWKGVTRGLVMWCFK